MARPALSAARGLDILDLLAAFPGRSFTLSDIMRTTGINAASCHAILSTLAERGYVMRNEAQKTFVLGPVPVAIGESALRMQPMLARAREVARDLASELAVPVLLTAAVGEEMVGIVAQADPTGRLPGLATGERRPMVPPLGAPFVAWESAAAISTWLARGGHSGDPVFAAEQQRALELIRQRGFQVTLRNPASPRLTPEAVAGYKDRMIGQVGQLVPAPAPAEITEDDEYDVILLAAPVFDRTGKCVYNLCLGDFSSRLSGRDVLSLADRLVTACLAVMQADR